MEESKSVGNEVSNKVFGETKNGKPLLVHHTNVGKYQVVMQGGGKLPKALSGLFTTQRSAILCINSYVSTIK